MERQDIKGTLLENEWEAVYLAHRWISFSPEKRATQIVKEFSELLESDLLELGQNQGNYKEKFLTHFRAWINAKSNCASSVIAGGANFNVRRAEKANNREHARSEDFWKFREKYFKAVNRQKTLSPEEELDLAQDKADRLTNLQQMMKDINSLVRKMDLKDLSKDEIEQKITHVLNEEDFPEQTIKDVIWNLNNSYGCGFPSFSLTNNNAKIKAAQNKVKIMRSRIAAKEIFEEIIFNGGKITIEDDRVKIFHEVKPPQESIDQLKSNGFRWSPHWKCWCRKHTLQALIIAKKITQ